MIKHLTNQPDAIAALGANWGEDIVTNSRDTGVGSGRTAEARREILIAELDTEGKRKEEE